MKKLYIFASSLILTLFASCDKENIVLTISKILHLRNGHEQIVLPVHDQ